MSQQNARKGFCAQHPKSSSTEDFQVMQKSLIVVVVVVVAAALVCFQKTKL